MQSWKYGDIDVETLGNPQKYGIDNDYGAALAEYMTKASKESLRDYGAVLKKRYSCSQNLAYPEIEVFEDDADFPDIPEAPQGYDLIADSVRTGFDEYGRKYMSYTCIKRNTHVKKHTKHPNPKKKSKQKNARRRCRK
ncbi:MAG: hypothetical protein NC110_00750 [Ruminococcus sp.]|nr:hypothetical protein [Ruminococcus sp.]